MTSKNELRLISLANDYEHLGQALIAENEPRMRIVELRATMSRIAKGLGEVCEIMAEEVRTRERWRERTAQAAWNLSDELRGREN